ncbi:hypothetical protein K2Z84_06670 [Candidatus Binatia bacterium]|nr:hypothetical protein [Candidatus Binatia bacterium]
MNTLPKKLVILALATLGLATLLAPAPSRAQEIPQPISRPCKHPCPNRIRFQASPRLDSVEIHARIVPVSSIDPANENFAFELTDGNGNSIFAAFLPAGSMRDTNAGKRVVYKNSAAKTAGGLYSVLITPRKDAIGGYRVDIRGYGDFTPPVSADITTFMAIGNDPFFDTRAWTPRADGYSVDFAP